MTRLLEGEVLPNLDPELERLRTENRRLARDLSDAKVEATRAREDADRALSALRRQLSPLYRALQAVFGELDAAGVRDDAPTARQDTQAATAKASPIWDAWKARLSTSCGKIIDALLLHGVLGVEQLVVATGISRKQTIYDSISAMKKAGIIDKGSDGRYALKQL
jgi:hypothetical protein